jgi:hypothetical protein
MESERAHPFVASRLWFYCGVTFSEYRFVLSGKKGQEQKTRRASLTDGSCIIVILPVKDGWQYKYNTFSVCFLTRKQKPASRRDHKKNRNGYTNQLYLVAVPVFCWSRSKIHKVFGENLQTITTHRILYTYFPAKTMPQHTEKQHTKNKNRPAWYRPAWVYRCEIFIVPSTMSTCTTSPIRIPASFNQSPLSLISGYKIAFLNALYLTR